MAFNSWSHKFVRVLVKPLANSVVTPNHLTTIRLLTGLAACIALAFGDRTWDIWGGALWVVSALFDRADGELARISEKSSEWGHIYDYYCDVTILGLFFIGVGIGAQDSGYGSWTILMGTIAGFAAAYCTVLAEKFAQTQGNRAKVYPSKFGFDFDDILYLFAPIIWLDWHVEFVIAAAFGAPIFVLITRWKLGRTDRQIP